MLKSILNLEGVQGLSKNQQKETNGGIGVGDCVVIFPVCPSRTRASVDIYGCFIECVDSGYVM